MVAVEIARLAAHRPGAPQVVALAHQQRPQHAIGETRKAAVGAAQEYPQLVAPDRDHVGTAIAVHVALVDAGRVEPELQVRAHRERSGAPRQVVVRARADFPARQLETVGRERDALAQQRHQQPRLRAERARDDAQPVEPQLVGSGSQRAAARNRQLPARGRGAREREHEQPVGLQQDQLLAGRGLHVADVVGGAVVGQGQLEARALGDAALGALQVHAQHAPFVGRDVGEAHAQQVGVAVAVEVRDLGGDAAQPVGGQLADLEGRVRRGCAQRGRGNEPQRNQLNLHAASRRGSRRATRPCAPGAPPGAPATRRA